MSTAERKARKRARREAGYPEDSAVASLPKLPTAHFLTKSEKRELRKRTKAVNLIETLRARGKSAEEITAIIQEKMT